MMSKRYDAQTVVIPFGGEAALTVVLRQDKTGHVLHAVSGDCSAGITFAQGRITAVRHPQSGDWLIPIPATDAKSLYGTLYYAPAATITKDTEPDTPNAVAFLFDAKSGAVFSDLVPMLNGRILVE
jgi:hypothetical protein